MNAANIKELISSLLVVDIDEVPEGITRASTAPKFQLFLAIIDEILNANTTIADRIRLCSIAREILSGVEPVLTAEQAHQTLELLMPQLHATQDAAISKSLVFLTALLETRISLRSSDLRAKLLRIYKTLPSNTAPEVISLAGRIARRLEQTQAVLEDKPQDRSDPFASRRAAFINVDIQKAASNSRIDTTKDWHTDPWNWPEIAWLSTSGNEIVMDRLISNVSGYVVKLDVAKDAKSTRPALIMNPVDRLAYQCLLDLISLELIGHLPSWVHGWRLDRVLSAKGCYADNKKEWQLFNNALATNRTAFRHVLRLDIRSFFASISQEVLLRQLFRQCRSFQLLERIEKFVYSWNASSGRSGLPQRFLPSSLIAQAFLRPLDDFLSRSLRSFGTRMSVIRWMDDIWLFSDDRSLLDSSFRSLTAILDQLGLEFNSEKTKSLDTKDPAFSLLITTSADEDNIPNASDDAITEWISQILENAEEAPRSKFGRFNAETLDRQHLELLKSLEKNLNNFPHVADFLANAIHVSERWENHEEWYVKYLDTQVSPTTWSVEAWAQMFPVTGDRYPEKLADAFAKKMGISLQTTVIPLSCDRLSSWRPAEATAIFARGADSLSTPFEFRSLGLAALSVGKDTKFVEECLGAHADTSYLLDAIRARGFVRFGGETVPK
ncbi:MAG: RNA-directed DNA polymerase [Planctomycetota bacterium]